MNHVSFDPQRLCGNDKQWWDNWQRKASAASLKAMQFADAGKPISFQAVVWSELKKWLLTHVFRGKCGYCESKLVVTDFGDADHYRPKGRVKNVATHTGYFWVAYDWRNLIPCCKLCNSGGKSDSFPIEGHRVFFCKEAAIPEELDKLEKPLLLHPYATGDHHPRRHLEFNEFGHVRARSGSLRGKSSIELCNLRRDDLVDERRKRQSDAWMRLTFISGLDDASEQRRAFMKQYRDGAAESSAAILDHIERRKNELNYDLQPEPL